MKLRYLIIGVYILGNVGGAISIFGGNDLRLNQTTCSNIEKKPLNERCNFARVNCSAEHMPSGRFNYLAIYYCSEDLVKYLLTVTLVVFLLLYFAGLGVTASDYLCPNLYTLSKLLMLSDNVAGVTLLAFGNGSPDVMSTYKAMKAGSASLAFSELIGATYFITTVVLGSMGVIKPFTVPKMFFVRDVLLLLLTVILISVSIATSSLNMTSCIILILIYLAYVILVVSIDSYVRLQVRKKVHESRSRANFALPSAEEENESHSLKTDMIPLPTIEELDLSEANADPVNSMENEVYSIRPPTNLSLETGSFGVKSLLKELDRHSKTGKGIHLGSEIQRPLTSPIYPTRTKQTNLRKPPHSSPLNMSSLLPHASEESLDSETRENGNPPSMIDNSNLETWVPLSSDTSPFTNIFMKLLYDFRSFPWFYYLFFEYKDYREYSLLMKVGYITKLPVTLMLRLSTPVRDYSFLCEVIEYSRDLVANRDEIIGDFNQLSLHGPVVTTQVFFSVMLITSFIGQHIFYRILIATISAVSIYAALNRNIVGLKSLNYLMSFVGFLTSIIWISKFAAEVVSILLVLSIIYKVSDGILGLTVFALGNSVGDLISNLAISKMGMPLMALSACLGGPLLSLCAIGLSGIIMINRTENSDGRYNFNCSSSVIFTGLGIIANLLFLLVYIPKNNWVLDRKIGFILLSNWILLTGLCILLEMS
ncbi:Piso0_000300 [Millerozyma farinosa CBS 7064]|uniref:Piso0_000300 protein n=1 Tax=Pichia sorbitophila (strain ATCC MYA-4447 / BCRC 22081 / CBS 7064 / NBRC 10061 / NRRL Y-12695) TaxID=559304 RepID=G8YTL9_PICSO|nr:Piso0_000300 [Millerozyma farinosa CBS 7064]